MEQNMEVSKVTKKAKAKADKTADKKQDNKKKILFSEEIDGKIESIRKNKDFCKEKGLENELEEGGKYYKSFSSLLVETMNLILKQVSDSMKSFFSPSRNPDVQKNMDVLRIQILKDSRTRLYGLLKDLDTDGISKLSIDLKKQFADGFVNEQVKALK